MSIEDKIDEFNKDRSEEYARYEIIVSGKKGVFFTLWRYSCKASVYANPYIFVKNLSTDLDKAVFEAIKFIENSNVKLILIDEETFNKRANIPAEILEFGKYKGESINDIYLKDPKYILWLSDNNYTNTAKGLKRQEMLDAFKSLYFETLAEENRKNGSSVYIGSKGDKLENIKLKVYKRKFYDYEYPYTDLYAKDADENRYIFKEPFTILEGEEVEILKCKVKDHVEILGLKYTRLFYCKYK